MSLLVRKDGCCILIPGRAGSNIAADISQVAEIGQKQHKFDYQLDLSFL